MKKEQEEKRKSREDQDALRRKEPLSSLDSSLGHCPGSSGCGTVLKAHHGVTAGPRRGKQAVGHHSRVEGLGAEARRDASRVALRARQGKSSSY